MTTWADIHQKAFDALKEKIRKDVVLYTKPFNLCCGSCSNPARQLWI